MGLDMYLYGELYAGTYMGKENFDRLNGIEFGHPWPVAPESYTIRATLAYWRKANAIHKWFVDNCQGGKDDCETYLVGVEQLRALSDLCSSLLESRDLDRVREELPPTSGFFFGGTDIDEHYWGDLELTVRQINRILTSEMVKAGELNFYYHSSW